MLTSALPLIRTGFPKDGKTLVMGVINTTPDSFSDGGVHYSPEVAVESALRMIEDGADIVDVGGESTRPGSSPIDVDEEIRRAVPVVRELCRRNPDAVVSIDTRRKAVAEAALEAGAQIVNDVSGFRDDPELIPLVRESGAAAIVMHMLGRPKTMQKNISYESFPGDVVDFLRGRIDELERAGIDPEKIVIDPGVGFGKTFDQNLILINRFNEFSELAKPVLLGASRKAFIGAILDEPEASRRVLGSVAVAVAGVLRGADIVRVHDVAETVQAIRVADAIRRERIAP